MEKISDNNPFIHYYYLINKTNSTIQTINNEIKIKINNNNNIINNYSRNCKQKVNHYILPAGVEKNEDCNCNSGRGCNHKYWCNSKGYRDCNLCINSRNVFFKKLYKVLFLYNFLLNDWKIQIIDNENVKIIKKIF
jgi:hypothetical protein